MDPPYRFALHIGWELVIFGFGVLAAMAGVFHFLKRKQDFGVEADLGRAASLCVYAGLIILGVVALGATVEGVATALRHSDVIPFQK